MLIDNQYKFNQNSLKYLITMFMWLLYARDMPWPKNIMLKEPLTMVSSISILQIKQ